MASNLAQMLPGLITTELCNRAILEKVAARDFVSAKYISQISVVSASGTHGVDSKQTGATLIVLARIHKQLKENDVCLQTNLQALNIFENPCIAPNAGLAEAIYLEMACIYRRQGQALGAVKYLRKCLKSETIHWHHNIKQKLLALRKLASISCSHGHLTFACHSLSLALTYWKDTEDIKTQTIHGAEDAEEMHPKRRLALSYHNERLKLIRETSSVLMAMDEPALAEPLLEKEYALKRSIFGLDHKKTLDATKRLCRCYSRLDGDQERVRKIWKRRVKNLKAGKLGKEGIAPDINMLNFISDEVIQIIKAGRDTSVQTGVAALTLDDDGS
ncbi:MAG: hypothetical protein MMC23_000297 [Stictis urceolatum]|nr:hypothetical protein [Stictis urceolata]